MIVDIVVCGYLVTDEQLVRFADLELHPPPPPTAQRALIIQTLAWIRRQPSRLDPVRVQFPRHEDPRTAPRRILFFTRSRRNVDHRFRFREIDEDLRTRERIMAVHPSIRVLLTNAEFVTFPNPSHTIKLPGEFIVRDTDESSSEEVLLPAKPSREWF